MTSALKKAAIYLGFAEEEDQLTKDVTPVEQPAQTVKKDREPKATVTPLHRAPAPQIVNEMNEILTVHPRQYRDAKSIAEAFRDGTPVIINLSQMTDGDARRLIDFSAGLTQGLNGRIERVTTKVYLLTPENITASGGRPSEDLDTADSAVFAH
ncbi:cell division protein SepF [Humidisolicoccus flavus]|uniref:cell division protein SepF n=1 Tax=Humidisolicoccus flavus TaxID=3111414 RepID=UPI003253A6D4